MIPKKSKIIILNYLLSINYYFVINKLNLLAITVTSFSHFLFILKYIFLNYNNLLIINSF